MLIWHKYKKSVLALFSSIVIFSNSAQAIEVFFKGNLIDNPPCDVYGTEGAEQPIKIEFNDIGITDIDEINGDRKGNYQQNFILTVSCGAGLGNSVALFMEYTGIKSPFYADALQTTVTDLGIYLESEGHVVKPQEGIKVVMSSNGTKQLQFTATPVRKKNAMLLEGKFTATATIQMLYP